MWLARIGALRDPVRYDGRELGGLPDKIDTASSVWADTAYRSKKNAKAGPVSKVHFRKPPGKPMPEPKQRADSARSRPRPTIERASADRKHRMGLFITTTGMARAGTEIGMADIARTL